MKRQIAWGLAVRVVEEKVGVVVEVGNVAVVSGIRVHRFRWDEPAVGDGHHRRMLLGIVGVKFPWCDPTERSSAVSLHTAPLGEAKLIYVRLTGKCSPTCLVVIISKVVEFWLERYCCSSRVQEFRHEAATVNLQTLLAWLVFEHACFLVQPVWVELREPLIVAVEGRVEVRRQAAPVRK